MAERLIGSNPLLLQHSEKNRAIKGSEFYKKVFPSFIIWETTKSSKVHKKRERSNAITAGVTRPANSTAS